MFGWVWDAARPECPIAVQVFVGDHCVLTAWADVYRPDLEVHGIGSGRHGFALRVPDEYLALAERNGQPIRVATAEAPPLSLGVIDVAGSGDVGEAARSALVHRLHRFSMAASALGLGTPRPTEASGKAVAKIFRAEEKPATDVQAASRLSPYADYIRHRFELAEKFDPETFATDRDRFLHWYVENYGQMRAPRRIPLSAADMRYLLEQMPLRDNAVSFPRVTLWFLLEGDFASKRLDPASPNFVRDSTYWWACERGPQLGIDDCLVSRQQVDLLARVERPDAGALPFSVFMELALQRDPELLAIGKPHTVGIRQLQYFAVLLSAAQTPSLLRYVPADVLDMFLSGSHPLFDRLAASYAPDRADTVNVTEFHRLIRARGFDLATRRFASVGEDGNRVEANCLTLAGTGSPVQVQLIGPFSRASGIGQACRISRKILGETALTCRVVDFAIDNPQPVEAGSIADAEPCQAAINIIHLNADLLPMAFAYMPDVFSNAYNIGFFFWELDRPAACHQLAIDLVDEIWVASEYNRRCFASATTKPVVNVGMAALANPPCTKEEARQSLAARLRIEPSDFVFLSAYDSLSYPQRKNPLGTVRAFQAAFPNERDVKLIIKTHNVSDSNEYRAKVWRELLQYSQSDPRVMIINETFGHNDFLKLVFASDCFVSLHRSEGFGFNLLESMALGVPVLCTSYSGNLEFCTAETSWLVDCDEVGVAHHEYIHVRPGHRWAQPRMESAIRMMRAVRCEVPVREQRSHVAKRLLDSEFSLARLKQRYLIRLRNAEPSLG